MKPKRIILIRHGESEGNVDLSIYSKKPDYAVRLTEKGKQQAIEAGQNIKNIIKDEDYCCYYSPYFRAHETMDLAIKVIDNNLDYNKLRKFKREEPRLREQEYSRKLRKDRHYDEKDREAYGKFFYGMDDGESGAMVYDRVSDCIGTLHRDFEKEDYPNNVLIFGHGMTNRLFLVRWFHIPIEEFEMWKNPKNGALYIMELQENNKYKLITEIDKHPKSYGYIYCST